MSWWRSPPLMERTLADDLKFGAAFLVGAALAVLLGLAEWGMVLAAAVGFFLMLVVLNVVRRLR
jgi:hypothetical protein